MLADPLVDWTALGEAAGAAVLGALVVVCDFGLALTGAVRMAEARRAGAGPAPAASFAMLAAGALVCAGALVVALLAMLHKT